MASDSHNTRLGGVKQELQDLKKDVSLSLADFKTSIDTKFDVISNRLNAIEENFQKHVNDVITKELNESVMSIKDSIIDALKEENFRLQQKVQHLEKKLSDIEIAENKLEQYTRRNNIEIQGIPSSVHDNLLEDKVVDIFSQLNITISKSDIEDCHRLGKANPKNTIVRFVNRKFCNIALEKKKQLMSLNKTELGFKPDVALYISENLTPFNQHLAWQCRELKRARLIHSFVISFHNCWSSKGVVKIRHTMNERALSIDSEKDLTVLYPDFVFKGRDGSK